MEMKENMSSNNEEDADQKRREKNINQGNLKYKNKKQIYIIGKGTGEEESASAERKIRTDRPTVIQYQVDDIVCMKKPHPCGSKEWKILRTGTDIKMRCQGCGHEVMIPRQKFEKQIKQKM